MKSYYERNRKEILSKIKLKKKKGGWEPITGERECKECGKKFKPGKHASSLKHRNSQIYCSKECGHNFREEKYEKIKNGFLEPGENSYQRFLRLRFEIFKRDKFTCQYCGRNVKEDKIKLEVEHEIPKSKGGKSIPENLITSCWECNHGKGDILLSERELKKRTCEGIPKRIYEGFKGKWR